MAPAQVVSQAEGKALKGPPKGKQFRNSYNVQGNVPKRTHVTANVLVWHTAPISSTMVGATAPTMYLPDLRMLQMTFFPTCRTEGALQQLPTMHANSSQTMEP